MTEEEKLIESKYLSIPGNLAYFDALTKVHNYNYLERVILGKYADQEIHLAFVDIDNLKFKNDVSGHSAGSDLIRSIAQSIIDLGFDEVIRYGGDEFIAISTSSLESLKGIESIRGVSIGYCTKQSGMPFMEAVDSADKMMIEVKAAKKCRMRHEFKVQQSNLL